MTDARRNADDADLDAEAELVKDLDVDEDDGAELRGGVSVGVSRASSASK